MTRAAWWWARKEDVAEPIVISAPELVDPGNQTFYAGQENVEVIVDNIGGPAESWLVDELPPGLLTQTAPYYLRIYGTVTPNIPVITDPGNLFGTVGVPFSYPMEATNNPTSWRQVNLPDGLDIDDTGLISGTPTTIESPTATITATNAGGDSAPVDVLVTISVLAPDVVKPADQTFYIGETITPLAINNVGGDADSWQATPLPDGLSVVNETPTQIIIGGRVEGPANTAPFLHDPGDQTVQVGQPFSLTIYNTGGPVDPGGWDVRVGWLPDGLTYDDSDPYQLVISGIPTEPEAPYVQTPKRSIPVRGDRINLSNPLAGGLVGYWPTLEWTGDSLHDYSVYSHHGTLVNSPARTSLGRQPAISYNGTNQACTIAPGVLAGATEYSFSFWCRDNRAGTSPADVVLEHSANFNTSLGSWTVYVDSAADRMLFSRRNLLQYSAGYITFLRGKLHHVAAISNSDGWRVWIDGTEADFTETNTSSEETPVPVETTYIASRNANSAYAEIELANFATYNRIITPTEIQTLYADPWALFR